jgi:hypothetical protein
MRLAIITVGCAALLRGAPANAADVTSRIIEGEVYYRLSLPPVRSPAQRSYESPGPHRSRPASRGCRRLPRVLVTHGFRTGTRKGVFNRQASRGSTE